MFTRDGRVLVNPNAPLGLPEFEHLYRNEGRTPAEAASNIFNRYPTEAKSYLDSQWNALGISDSPERYFARQAIAAPAPQMQPIAAPVRRGISPSEPAAGGMDPLAQRQITTNQNYLLPNASMTQDELRSAQLAGDAGDVKRFLLKRQGIKYEDYLSTPPDAKPLSFMGKELPSARAEIKPYQPASGLGNMSDTTNPSRLDTTIYNDPDFRQLRALHPERAANMYSRLTGRDLSGDEDETLKLRASQLTAGRTYAGRAIASGAQYDPVGKQWKVWNQEPADPNAINSIMGGSRASQQLAPATQEQNDWLNQHYNAITGHALPVPRSAVTGNPLDLTQGAHEAANNLRQLQNDNEFIQMKREKEYGLRRSLTPVEINALANDYRDALSIRANQPNFLSSAMQKMEAGARYITGVGDRVPDPSKSPARDIYDNSPFFDPRAWSELNKEVGHEVQLLPNRHLFK